MRKLSILLILILLAAGFLAAQDLDDLVGGFEDFSGEVANSLPLASNIGLNWNDAYTDPGLLPISIGAGLTLGSVMIPSESFNNVAESMQISEITDITSQVGLGVPLPVYSLDGRVGLKFIPLDVGVKFGTITPEIKDAISFTGVHFDYSMIGFDLRYAVIKGNVVLPEISVGAGYTHLSGNVSMPLGIDQSVDASLAFSNLPGTDTLALTNSNVFFTWETHAIDFKVQASKQILILNLSVGAGYTFGESMAGGGFDADLTLNGDPISAADKAFIESAGLDIGGDNLKVIKTVDSQTARLFGGAGVNLGPLKLDLGAIYGIPSNTLAVSSNIRVQF